MRVLGTVASSGHQRTWSGSLPTWEARDMISETGLVTNLLGDLGQVTGPLSASVSLRRGRFGRDKLDNLEYAA